MVININPNRINLSPGLAGKLAERKRSQEQPAAEIKPAPAHVNYIPEPQSLSTLINSAVAALRKGVRWDRGTILNLLV